MKYTELKARVHENECEDGLRALEELKANPTRVQAELAYWRSPVLRKYLPDEFWNGSRFAHVIANIDTYIEKQTAMLAEARRDLSKY